MKLSIKIHCLLLASVAVLFFTGGCKEEAGDKLSNRGVDIADEKVLAMVNGSSVTEVEVEQAIVATIGAENAFRLEEKGRRKVLESLVASRAISQACEKELSADSTVEIERKVAAFREQLLVKKYLSLHATPQPVTQEMVEKYYNSHLERFGEKSLRSYEMISAGRSLNSSERGSLISELKKPDEHENWENWVGEMKVKGFPVYFKQGEVVEKMLHPKLYRIMSSAKKGEATGLTFIDGRPYILKITGERKIPARPLHEVSAGIRKSLVPVQLKKAVRKISKEVLSGAEVSYSS